MTSALPEPFDDAVPLVWERAEPAGRPTPSLLSRERIVTAAVGLADGEGLEAVSLRKVAAALDAGPMRLYGYISTKAELLELMADAVYGELVAAGPFPLDWRDALREQAHRTRASARAHPWFVDLLGGRPLLGPHALAYLEASLAALAPAFADIDAVLRAHGAVTAYVIGAVRGQTAEERAVRESGLDKDAWQRTTYAYLRRVMAAGTFPTLSRVITEARHLPPDEAFACGLECVLAGIAAHLSPR